MSRSLIFLLLVACSDYDLRGLDKPEAGAEPDTAALTEDTGEPAPEPEDDTGEDAQDDPDLGQPGSATAPIYLHTEDTLFAWSPGDGTSEVGAFSDDGVRMTDIAIDLQGRMLGIATEDLYAIDAETAAVSYLCSIDQYANGLTFLSDGQLVGAGAGIFSIDPSTCDTRAISDGDGFQTAGDVVGLPGERLLWTVNGNSGDRLVAVDPATGATTLIGALGVSGLWGVGYADGLLHGFAVGGQAVVIDPDTAAVQSVESLAGAWWGATTNPVRW